MSQVIKNVFHMFGAIGGGALGFQRARVRVGAMEGTWKCVGSVDVDAAANRVFAKRVGVPATTLDLADRSQYTAIHGKPPPEGWREAIPDDIRKAANGQKVGCLFLSAPCKGFSGLLSKVKSETAKYQAMNGLAERGLWLALEAWADDPVPLILFENVPALLTRGRAFVDQIITMLRFYGYAVAETVHDCGALGGLAQSRKRCLIVARHMAKVPNFLYEPPTRPLRAVGDVLSKLWMPGDAAAGPMHRIPQLQFRTWVRLALVEPGSDWRSLNKLAVQEGVLRDYCMVRDSSEVGASVADPRVDQSAKWNHGQQYGVHRWDESTGTVTAQQWPNQGRFAVADPRHMGPAKHSNEFRIVPWSRASGAITGAHGSGQCVADPRCNTSYGGSGKYLVTPFDQAANTVIGASTTGQGAFAVADPRTGMAADRAAYLTGGHYGVMRWAESSGAVSAAACHDNGRWSVADPRIPEFSDRLVARIRSLDGTWHRPFTTLELGALQSLFDPEDPADIDAFTFAFTSESKSDSVHREWTGNAVPPEGMTRVAEEMLRTLMLADAGETFQLNALPIWVRPVAAAINLAQGAAT